MFRVWFNPKCSKCRQAKALLDERGVEYELYEYLATPPTRAELDEVLAKLGESARAIVRSKEAEFAELGLAEADDEAVLAALSEHPKLIERPILVGATRAVVARPPERLLELLEATSRSGDEAS